MSNVVIPLQAIAAQTISVQLGAQQCSINLYQKAQGLFFDLSISGTPIVTSMLCLDRVSLVRQAYLGFIGNLSFVDTQGTNTPYYTGLGSRYILVYFTS